MQALHLRSRLVPRILPLSAICGVKMKAKIPEIADLLIVWRVRHRFRATFSRQPRQVRKEATVTGSFVCSGRRCLAFFVPALLP